MEIDKIGEFTLIKFRDGMARIERGELEPSYTEEGYYQRQKAILICKYKILFKRLFNISDFDEEICKFFEKMNYCLEIEEFDDGRKNVNVIDLIRAGIIASGDNLISVLTELDLKRKENLVQII